MRILMISALDVWALSGQGGAPSLSRTLEAYGRAGHEIDFVSPTLGANHHHGQPAGPLPSISGVTFHSLRLPSLLDALSLPSAVAALDQKVRFAMVFPILAARKAALLARHREPDVLYGYEVHGVLAQRFLRRRFRLPLVARFQGTVMHPHIGSMAARLRRYEEVVALRTPADLYVMTNDGTRGDEVLQRLNPASRGKVRFWRNGLDLSHVRPPSAQEAADARRSLQIPDDAFVLVTAVRLARWKRVDRAIDALATLRRTVPGALLLTVGDGEERRNLEVQAKTLGLADGVRFVGAVPQTEVQRYLWAADVFLCVNELSNVGNPLLEAMAAGRCILTTDEGDTRDLIEDGRTGVLLTDPDPAVIAAALALLAADPSVRSRLAGEAADLARREFWTWEERMNAEIAEVERLVDARSLAMTNG
jgi:glycosyltransferase involved in cell wall biosynthesis